MSNCSKPVTDWRTNKTRKTRDNDGLEEFWDKVIGDNVNTNKPKTALTPKEVSLDSHQELVSIRCRRHKKRFNVQRKWLDVCSWLCPKCYDKISALERKRYAPANEKYLDIRKAEKGKPTLLPSGCHSQELSIDRAITKIQEPSKSALCLCTHDTTVDREKTEIQNQSSLSFKRYKEVEFDCYPMSNEMASLMPLWRLVCKKCRREVPVHKIWIDNTSKVLCPECYSQMNSYEVETFHLDHPASLAQLRQVKPYPISIPSNNKPKPIPSHIVPFRSFESTDESFGGHCKSSTIMRMTVQELSDAVRSGRVSRVRAKIEMKRRKRASYFNDLPDVNPVSPLLPR